MSGKAIKCTLLNNAILLNKAMLAMPIEFLFSKILQ